MKKLLLLCLILLNGCTFTGYGVNYDSGVWLRIKQPDMVIETTLSQEESVAEVIKALK